MDMTIFRSSLLVFISPWLLFGQSSNLKSPDAFRFIVRGDTIEHPLLGGWLTPKCEFADLDGDGDPDLFVVQVDGRVTWFENTGSSTTPEFNWRSDDFDSLRVENWARWADMDADGDLDILASGQGSIVRYFENVGTPQAPHYELRITPLRDTANVIVLSEFASIPDLVDIDGDGDLDLFSGRSAGTVAFYENVGRADSMAFRFVTDEYQNILIISVGKRAAAAKHGASGIRFYDVDQDGDPDLFWGDFFSTRMYFLENAGTADSASFPTVVASGFPEATFQTKGFNMPVFCDIDGDGDRDLFVNVLNAEQGTDNFWFYTNNLFGSKPFRSNVLVPPFSRVTRNYIPTIDLGRQSAPFFYDWNGDGATDLVVGNYDGAIAFYEGSSPLGETTFEEDTLVDLPFTGYAAVPALADCDGDGDGDLIVGFFDGTLSYYRNTGTTSNPSWVLQNNVFDGIDVGYSSAPFPADLDRDGDVDLIVGNEDGRLFEIKNTGTPQSPVWNALVEILSASGRTFSVPFLGDRDGDGDADLWVGYLEGDAIYFENRGDSTEAVFAQPGRSFGGIRTSRFAVPRVVTTGSETAVLMGNLRGGLEFFQIEPEAPTIVQIPPLAAGTDSVYKGRVTAYGEPPPVFTLTQAPVGMTVDAHNGEITWQPAAAGSFPVTVQATNSEGSVSQSFTLTVSGAPISSKPRITKIFPNPSNGSCRLEFTLPFEGFVSFKVYNILGQEVVTLLSGDLAAGTHFVSWEGSDRFGRNVASGVYFGRLAGASGVSVRRMLIVR